jgi:hypothetical protein
VAVIGLPGDKGFANHPGALPKPLCVDLTGYTKTIRELLVLPFLFSSDHQRRRSRAVCRYDTDPVDPLSVLKPRNFTDPTVPARRCFQRIACSPVSRPITIETRPATGTTGASRSYSPRRFLACALELLAEEPVR